MKFKKYNYYCLLILCICKSVLGIAQGTFTLPIDEGWKLRNSKQTSWTNVTIPSCVQTELIKQKMLSNPYWGCAEKDCQWVENENYEYAVYFDIAPSMANQKNVQLILEGVDTYAKIILNGKELGIVNNANRTWTFDIKSIVERNNNCLLIQFDGLKNILDSLAKINNQPLTLDNRVFLRKPAYQFGWDFSPHISTIGITKPVYLKSSNGSIDVFPKFKFLEPMAKFDSVKFQFSKNGKPIFIRGANIVPPSVLYPIANKYYDSLINQCKESNINMLRIWGGGIYPPDYFYDLCDKNNIMIWQDFMFANTMFPVDENLKTNRIEEVTEAVKRLQNHPCIVLWCGNNEIEEGWKNWGWKQKFSDPQAEKIWQDYVQFFQKDIPKIISENDGIRPYISTTPKIGWGNEKSMHDGDAHYWGVWWGKEPIENYWYKVPRFMSEFGMQALPDIHSIHEFCEPKQMKLSDSNFTNHQKCKDGFEKIRYYLQNYPENKDSLGYIYFSQLLQRDAMQTAISAQRSAFPYCNGSMPWQWNDVWPAISWSIVDYFGRPKAAFYSIKKLYAKNALALGKFIAKNDRNIFDTSKHSFALSICDPTFDIANTKTTFTVFDFYGDAMYKTTNINWEKGEGGNYYTTSFFDKNNFNSYNWGISYLLVEVKNKEGIDLQQPFFFTQPKNLKLQPTTYTVKWLDETTVKIISTNFAKDVYLYCNNPKVKFSDNYFDLLPTQEKIITVTEFNKKAKDNLQVFSQIDMSYE